ncbi:MAG TPA: hypothetical protein VJV04_04630 [Nitrospiraceae bacterium]|nr:hypothetical protein [Nitrospiraceae bacterium]
MKRDVKLPMARRLWPYVLALVVIGCTHDPYQQRADAIKDHVEAFYSNLKSGRVASAIRDNEQIEAMAGQMGQTIRTRLNQPAMNQVDREGVLYKAASETAVENWLSLGRYFMIKKRYDQARATYQRILDTYTGSAYRTYVEQAEAGLRDVNIVDPPKN